MNNLPTIALLLITLAPSPRDPQGKPRATLRILGNPTESYRDLENIERGDP